MNLLNYHFVTRPSTLMKRVKMRAWLSYSYSDSLPALDRGEGEEGVIEHVHGLKGTAGLLRHATHRRPADKASYLELEIASF